MRHHIFILIAAVICSSSQGCDKKKPTDTKAPEAQPLPSTAAQTPALARADATPVATVAAPESSATGNLPSSTATSEAIVSNGEVPALAQTIEVKPIKAHEIVELEPVKVEEPLSQ